MDLTVLQQCEIFKEFHPEELRQLLPLARRESFPGGAVIFLQKAAAERVYLLDRGAVALKTAWPDGLEITFELLNKTGAPFGWSALVEPHQLTASAVCLEKSEVLSFAGPELTALLVRTPALGCKVFRNLCSLIARRLQRTRELVKEQIR